MSDTHTINVLFTDLVGSTSLASSVGPVVAEQLRQEHFTLLREAIAGAEGEEIKSLGDGLMVTLPSASRAVACAVDMQQRLELRNASADEQLAIRVGIASGEADRAEGDWFGPPVVTAARLCAYAHGGQILVAPLVKALAADRGDLTFKSLGAIALKGIPKPVEAFEVPWEPRGATAHALPLPQRLQSVPPVSYVGRESERERLAALWTTAKAERSRAVVISGEPGIGKTRLASHTALEIHGEGGGVLYGRCEEELSTPYGPWIQALGHLVEHAPQELLDAHALRHGGALARLVPGLRLRVPELPAPPSSDPETERFLLFAAVGGLLEAARAAQPLVLLLDDLHWADKPTLMLMKHVIGESTTPGQLVIGTYRESDLTRDHPLTDMLAQLPSIADVERIALRGLAESDVVAIMTAAAGHELTEDGLALARHIAVETDGNAFFVGEMLRHLSESEALVLGDDGRWVISGGLASIGLPQSVREVVGRRVERLGERAVALLRTAAVIGRDFDVGLLVRVVQEDEDALLDHLEAAVAASVLVERPEPGTFSFAHALINHTLYDELGATRRARIHQRIAEALEEICGADTTARVTELAHHWVAASAPVEPQKAIVYSCRAGERALADLAPDEALRWFTQARALQEKTAPGELRLRAPILLGLGRAQSQTGESAFRETLLEAARVAYELRDPDIAAAAAAHNNLNSYSVIGDVDEERVEAVEHALELDGGRDPARRARLLALHAQELGWHPDFGRRSDLAEEAIATARTVDDPRTLAEVIYRSTFALWSPHTVDRRIPLIGELLELASQTDDPALACHAQLQKFDISVDIGSFDEANRAGERARAIAEESGSPTLGWLAAYVTNAITMFSGTAVEAQQLADEVFELGQRAGQVDAALIYAGQTTYIAVQRGDTETAVAILRGAVELYPKMAVWRAGLASVLALADEVQEARAIVDSAAAGGFRDTGWDFTRLATLQLYAETVVFLDMAGPAALLLDLLDPFSDRVIWTGTQVYGPARTWTGALSSTLGQFERADADLALACEWSERNGLHVARVRALMEWAKSFAARGRSDRASELATTALELMESYGWRLFAAEAEALITGTPVRAAAEPS